MDNQDKGHDLSRTEKTLADIDREYRGAIRKLTALYARYQTGLAQGEEEFEKTESRLRFAYESRKAKIEEHLSAKKSRLYHTLQDTLKGMERRKNSEISTIKSRASMMRKEIATAMDVSSKAVQRAHRALGKVNIRSLFSI